jgi:hypothetical protein
MLILSARPDRIETMYVNYSCNDYGYGNLFLSVPALSFQTAKKKIEQIKEDGWFWCRTTDVDYDKLNADLLTEQRWKKTSNPYSYYWIPVWAKKPKAPSRSSSEKKPKAPSRSSSEYWTTRYGRENPRKKIANTCRGTGKK